MTGNQARSDASFYGLLALVLIAPIPFGAVMPWAWLPLSMASGLLLLGFSSFRLLRRETPAVSIRSLRVPLGLMAIVMAWAVVQILPSPAASLAHPVWAEASLALGKTLTSSISATPDRGFDILLRWLSCMAVFWLALNHGRKSQNTRRLLLAVAISAAISAAYGLWAETSGAKTVLGVAKTQYIDSLTGTFINKNHAATFFGFGILCAMSLLLMSIGSIPKILGPSEKMRMLGQRLSGKHLIPPAALVLLVPALLMTDSRAGVVLTFLATAFLVIAARLTRSISRNVFLAMLALVLLPAFLLLAFGGGTSLAERFGFFGQDWDVRMNIYKTTMEAIADAPFIGTGLGSFPDIFRLHHDGGITSAVTQAHNVYLELALELGIPAAILMLIACAWPALRCAAGMARRQQNRLLPATGAAVALLAATHSAFDFSLQMPGLALVFWAIMGACAAQGWSTRKSI